MLRKYVPALLLLAGAPALAGERQFSVAGEPFRETEIVDARAQPEIDGTSSIRITFGEAAAKRIAAVTGRLVGKAAAVMLDNRTIADPIVREAIRDGVLQVTGAWSVSQAEEMAHKISGKAPLPDSLEE